MHSSVCGRWNWLGVASTMPSGRSLGEQVGQRHEVRHSGLGRAPRSGGRRVDHRREHAVAARLQHAHMRLANEAGAGNGNPCPGHYGGLVVRER